MKSITIVTVMLRLTASASWSGSGVVPVDEDGPVRSCGVAPPASSNAAAMTAGMSSVTEAVSHFPVPRLGAFPSCSA